MQPQALRDAGKAHGLYRGGDVKAVAHGVYEMREFFGPGWRMYYARRGEILILMLGGGTKATQARDIERAIALAESIEE